VSSKILSQVLRKVTPSKSEEKMLNKLTDRIIAQINATAKELGVD